LELFKANTFIKTVTIEPYLDQFAEGLFSFVLEKKVLEVFGQKTAEI
jgi:hypothetical protein